MRKIKTLFFVLALGALQCQAQRSDLVKTYIETYKDLAIAEMQRTGIPASITLAQGIYESTAGTSELVLQSNNHFGIKCKSDWTGESVKHDDDLKNECFRKYEKAEDSYKDHSDFLKKGTRYAFLFNLDPTNYTGWAYGLKKAGYATSSRYPQALIKLIETYDLQDYTLIALGKKNNDGIMTAAITTNGSGGGAASADEIVIPQEAVKLSYPEGEFRINEVKVILGKKGTSWLAIAKKYDVDLSKLFEYNEIPKADLLDKDQLVYLQRKNKYGSSEIHVVKEGESLHDVAQVEGIRMESLQEMNGLRSGGVIQAGEQLMLKKTTKKTN